MAAAATTTPPSSLPTPLAADADANSSSRRRAAVAAEARALLEGAMHRTMEGWRATAAAQGAVFNPSEDVLVILSGGVDSSITFHLAASLHGVRHCATLLAAEGAGTDIPWCRAVAAHVERETLAPRGLALVHEVLAPSLPELLADDMPFLIETLTSFDPMALRNSVCVARVLQWAHARGFRHVLTGDAADELLAGYSYSARLPDAEWTRHRQGMVARMHFDAIEVGQALGVAVASPYLDEAFVAFALGLGKQDCVGPVAGLRATPDDNNSSTTTATTTTGKIPIRDAFPSLPSSSRRKDPVEIGSGTTLLGAAPWADPPRPQGYFDLRIDAAEFEAARAEARARHGVVLRDREHLAYFRLFVQRFTTRSEDSELLAVPGKPRPNDDPCPACAFPLPHARATFCLTCGHYDAAMEFRHDVGGAAGSS